MSKILVIDDSQTEVEVVRHMLESAGYQVLWADNADKGIALAEKEQPDLILMDIVMPEMNGFQATRKITRDEATGHIPVVIVSTKDQETDRVWGKRQGATEYLVKPINEEELIGVIRSVLG